MAKDSLSKQTGAMPAGALESLRELGRNLSLARKRRRMTQRELAARGLVSVPTLRRLERGDPSVGLGVLAQVLFVLGLERELAGVAAPDRDREARRKDLDALPQRVRAGNAERGRFDF